MRNSKRIDKLEKRINEIEEKIKQPQIQNYLIVEKSINNLIIDEHH